MAHIDKHDTIEGAAGAEARAPAGVRLRLPAAERPAVDPLAGAHPDDGGRPAVHLRGHLEDGEHAQGEHARRRGRRLHGGLAAGAEGPGHLPRRVEGGAAALDAEPRRTRRRKSCWPPRAASACPTPAQSITHKFSISGHEGYITVGLYPDGRPGELFITMAKEGSTIGGLMDCFGTAVSMSLQYGVPLEVYVNKFSHTRFEPMGFTKNPDIKIAKSIVDYIFRWLGITFLPGYREANKMVPPSPADVPQPEPEPGDAETEPWPAATMAGGPIAAQGSAPSGNGAKDAAHVSGNGHAGPKQAAKRNGSPAGAAKKDRVGQTFCLPLSARRCSLPQSRSKPRPHRCRAANNSPRSKPTLPPATTAAPSPSATATATSATTAAAAWGVRRRGAGGRGSGIRGQG